MYPAARLLYINKPYLMTSNDSVTVPPPLNYCFRSSCYCTTRTTTAVQIKPYEIVQFSLAIHYLERLENISVSRQIVSVSSRPRTSNVSVSSRSGKVTSRLHWSVHSWLLAMQYVFFFSYVYVSLDAEINHTHTHRPTHEL